jgi:hypothetical protein
MHKLYLEVTPKNVSCQSDVELPAVLGDMA